MDIVIRADASVQIGSGHVMRCLTLAERLKAQGFDVGFISRNLPGNMNEYIMSKGFKVFALPFRSEVKLLNRVLKHEDWLGDHWELDCRQTLEIIRKHEELNWLIVDHYALDYRWEEGIRPVVGNIMVIDDLADRVHQADLLLDQNYHNNMEVRYQGLVPFHCLLLLGPRYALLRQEFTERRNRLRKRTGKLQRVLVFFGGSDLNNVTGMAVRAFLSMKRSDLTFDVIVGESNPAKEQIRELCRQSPNFHYYCQVDDMAGIIENADLAFGAAGASTWERLCLGLPSIVVSVAENQDTLLEGIMEKELLICIGNAATIQEEHFVKALNQVLEDEGKRKLQLMSAAGMDFVDGLGCERVASAISEI